MKSPEENKKPPTAAPGKRWKLFLKFAAKILLSMLIIGFLANRLDFQAVGAQLAGINPVLGIVAAALLFIQVVPLGLAWGLILRGIGTPLSMWIPIKIFAISLLFHQVLPATLGGIGARAYFAYREKITLSKTANSVFLERVFHGLALIVFVFLALPLLSAHVGLTDGNFGVFVFIAASIVGLFILFSADKIFARFQNWRPVRALSYLASDTRLIFFSPRNLASLFGLQLFVHSLTIVATYVLTLALSIEISPLDFFAVFPPILLVSIAPISMNGWGVREAAMIGFLSYYSVPAEQAFALSISFGIAALVSRLPGAVVFIFSKDKGR